MDYGKLAYLKAVDLESRLSVGENTGYGVKFSEYKNVPAGKSEIVKFDGRGEIAVFVHSSQSAVFYMNGLKVFEGKAFFFKWDGSGSLMSQSETDIDSLRVLAIGDLSSADGGGALYADIGADSVGYLLMGLGRAEAFVADKANFVPKTIFEGECLHGDICAFGNDFIVAVTDGSKVKLICTDGKTAAYDIPADKIAVSYDGFIVTLAFVREGKLFVTELSGFGGSLGSVEDVYFTGPVDDVRLVKGSGKIMFSSGGKCYIKDISDRAFLVGGLYVDMLAEVI